MSKTTHQCKGFGAVGVLLVIVVTGVIGLGGWYMWQMNTDTNNTSTLKPVDSTTKPQNNHQSETKKSLDATEGGKFLVIDEWKVRTQLPEDLQGKVTYIHNEGGDSVDPETNLPIESADIYIKTDVLTAGDCAVININSQSYTTTVIQYIRSDTSKPFNSTRYERKGIIKPNLLNDTTHAYHLNYITPDCMGSEADIQKLHRLHNSLLQLEKL